MATVNDLLASSSWQTMERHLLLSSFFFTFFPDVGSKRAGLGDVALDVTRWEGCEWNVLARATHRLQCGAVTCSWQLLAQIQTFPFQHIDANKHPPNPHATSRPSSETGTQRRPTNSTAASHQVPIPLSTLIEIKNILFIGPQWLIHLTQTPLPIGSTTHHHLPS